MAELRLWTRRWSAELLVVAYIFALGGVAWLGSGAQESPFLPPPGTGEASDEASIDYSVDEEPDSIILNHGKTLKGHLGPGTELEVRFPVEMVGAGQVGQGGARSPLVINPPVKGDFIWLSRRSGMFKPAAPYAFDALHTVRLREGLVDGAGNSIESEPLAKLSTPPMMVDDDSFYSWELGEKDIEVALAFNTAVNAKAAEKLFEFRDSKGQVVSARATTWKKWDPSDVTREDLDWAGRFDWDHHPDQRASLMPAGSVISVCLKVTPKTLLPAGTDWKLVAKKGIPSADGKHKTVADYVVELGDIYAPEFRSLQERNEVNVGRSLHLRFSRPVSPALKDDLARWVKIKPTVKGLQAEVEGRWLAIRGKFELGVKYKVQVKAGLPGRHGREMTQDHEELARFYPLASRTYLSARAHAQYSGGHRKLSFVSVNNSETRLRVKLIDSKYLAGTLEAYTREYPERSGYIQGRWVSRASGHPLSYNLVPGKSIFDREYDTGAPTDHARKMEVSWDDILKGRNAGVAFVSVEGAKGGRKCVTQSIIQLTDLGMTWKVSGGGLLAWVFSQRTGLPVAGAKVGQVSRENEAMSTVMTDANGLAYMRLPSREGWLQATHGADQLLAPLDDGDNKMSLWNFNLFRPWDRDEKTKARVTLYTERPLYRPGETVHLKGVIRGEEGFETGKLTGVDVLIACRDSRGDTFFEDTLTISRHGSFNTDIPLPAGALGRYRINADIQIPGVMPESRGVVESSHWVNVQEFEPDTFKIKFSGKTDLPAGSPLAVPLEARYYFGKPLAGAQVKWSLTGGSVNFYPQNLEDYRFDISHHTNDGESIETVIALNGQTRLDDSGCIVLKPDVRANPRYPQPTRFWLETTVTDVNQQSLSGSRELMLHSSDFYLGIRKFSRVVWAGQPLPLSVVAVDTAGRPLERALRVKAVLKQIQWRSVPMQGAGKVTRFHNEKQIRAVAECELRTVAPGEDAQARLVPREAGEYLLEVHGVDAGGRPVMSAHSFYVSGPQPLAWDYENEFQIDLVPDKPVYRNGETARLLLKTPIEGRCLITVERSTIRRSFVTELTGNAPVVEVPLREGDAPNVFVSVLVLRGADASRRKVRTAEFRLGYATLKVEQPGTHLSLDLKMSQEDYRPGREVFVSGVVQDHEGQPVVDAEVTLYAVDEGILALMPTAVPDLHSFFHQQLPHDVDTYSTFPQMLSENLAHTSFGNKGHLIGGGGSDGIKTQLRKDFLPCAYWNAALHTDEQGRVEARFKAPDSLTRYRVMAVVHAKDAYGSAKTTFRINKPLTVEASLPPFARAGDRMEARAVIHNQTDADHEVQVTLKAPAPAQLDNDEKRLTIPAHTTRAVVFPIEFIGTGRIYATWQAQAVNEADLADAMQSAITVRPAAPLLRELRFISTDAAEVSLLEDFDPQLLEGQGMLTLRLSNSRLLELGESADYLLKYPYGCVEQTSSSLLPWLMLNDLPMIRRTPAEREKAIKHGVRRLLGMQTSSGGLGYWPGERSPDFWGTAYGGLALALAKENGIAVPGRALDRIAKFLSRNLRNRDGDYLGDQALAVYTLTLMGRAEPAYHEVLYKNRNKLRPGERALLALAILLHQGSDDRVPELLPNPNPKKNDFEQRFGGDERTLAMRLLAWTRYRHDAPAVEKLVEQLIAARHEGHWRTTQGNAWSLLALTEYIRRVEAGARVGGGTIKWRGQEKPFKLDPKTGLATLTFDDAHDLKLKDLILSKTAGQRLYAQVKLEVTPANPITVRQNRGFSVRRVYERVNGDGSVDKGGNWEVGDLVRVTLHVDTMEYNGYVVIDDPLPAAFEGVNQEFATRAVSGGQTRGNWWSNHSEMRADRALFFRNHLPSGSYTLRYLARVRAAGETIAPATKVEAMYRPSRHGLSAGRKVTTQSIQ